MTAVTQLHVNYDATPGSSIPLAPISTGWCRALLHDSYSLRLAIGADGKRDRLGLGVKVNHASHKILPWMEVQGRALEELTRRKKARLEILQPGRFEQRDSLPPKLTSCQVGTRQRHIRYFHGTLISSRLI
jgi:hypothetical protein